MTLKTDVAVIGSGFSAVALALNLVDLLPPTAKVSLVGKAAAQGRGIAYATKAECHLLNVPAGRMSLFADRPNHFLVWLAEEGYPWSADDFVPRRIYGNYVRHCLDEALKRTGNRAALTLVDAEALSAEAAQDGGLVFVLSDGGRLSAEASALCTGAGTRRLPLPQEALSPAAEAFVVHDPWADAWWERLPADGDVLFVGTGLTTVDQALLLARRGFRGTMHALSRHGLLPQPHLFRRADPVAVALAPGEVSAMLAALRAQASAAPDWRAVMDGLRPVTQALWHGFSATQRARFLRHAASFWNVHRHRMAPAVAQEIEGLRQAEKLVIHRGRLAALRLENGRLAADLTGHPAKTLTAHLVVNCTGLDRCTVKASPLLTSLAEKGLLRPDPHGLGIVVDGAAAVLAAEGVRSARLFALGPLTAGHDWEITAVPDIRVQARAVAERIEAGMAAG